jgi:anti-sigma-K factor RskA
MIDETKQDLAIAYLLGELKGPEGIHFVQALERDPELQELVRSLEATLGDVALLSPPVAPPERVAQRLFDQIGKTKIIRFNYLPWSLAAAVAIACAVLALVRDSGRSREVAALREKATSVESELAAVRQQSAAAATELVALRQKSVAAEGENRRLTALAERYRKQADLSEMKIATLSSQVQNYATALAVVVWDTEKQEGLVKLSKLPKLQAGKDYQLWVIDPAYKQPVSAGIVAPDANGYAKTVFKPAQIVHGAETFAVSIEKAGGAVTPQGQIVLAGK